MSMKRTIAREIARNRLKDAGYERVNKRIGMTTGGKREHEMEEKMHGSGTRPSRMKRAFLEKQREKNPQVWRRVLYGDLAKAAENAWRKASFHRALQKQSVQVMKHRKIRKITEPAT